MFITIGEFIVQLVIEEDNLNIMVSDIDNPSKTICDTLIFGKDTDDSGDSDEYWSNWRESQMPPMWRIPE